MANLNRKCCICGKEYAFCFRCDDDKPSWMASFCSENHKNIYTACAGYNAGHLTKDETKILLDKCDLSDKESFSKATQDVINELYKENVKEIKEEKIVAKQSYTNNKVSYNKSKNKKR